MGHVVHIPKKKQFNTNITIPCYFVPTKCYKNIRKYNYPHSFHSFLPASPAAGDLPERGGHVRRTAGGAHCLPR